VAWRIAEEEGEEAPRGVTFTFDTGMLIALERRKQRAVQALRAIVRRDLVPIVPAVVYVEWWRGRTDVREEILETVEIEQMPRALCRAAGEALTVVRGATLADAVVMASAALRGGGIVYTSDSDDLAVLQRHFPTVGIIAV
jgi:predicted nucleic acid-binding protein